MPAVKIKNIIGTYDTKCSCDSWLDHWKNFSNQAIPRYCPASRCLETELIGAHVQKGGGSTDHNRYIYPLCKVHNKHPGELEVPDIYKLVPVNKKETCEK